MGILASFSHGTKLEEEQERKEEREEEEEREDWIASWQQPKLSVSIIVERMHGTGTVRVMLPSGLVQHDAILFRGVKLFALVRGVKLLHFQCQPRISMALTTKDTCFQPYFALALDPFEHQVVRSVTGGASGSSTASISTGHRISESSTMLDPIPAKGVIEVRRK